MKIIGLIFGLLFSITAFSSLYSGAGDWKSNKGASGNYSVQATIEPTEDFNTIVINQTLTFEDKVLDFSVVLQKIDDNFYYVLNSQGVYVGTGYCWQLAQEDDKICHTESNEDGFFVESTIHKTANAIYRIGSKINNDGTEKIIWKDELLLQNGGMENF